MPSTMLVAAEHEVRVMQFRWVALLTMWTMLVGPILAPPGPPRANANPTRPPAGTANR